MGRIILAAAALTVVLTAAAAQPRHDISLEKAAAAIVAQKIGEIRGGFDYDAMPEFVRPIDWLALTRRAATRQQPLASFVEPSLR